MKEDIELSIVMPCLNESKTLGICIEKAMRFIKENDISGEIVIADNGSTDNSVDIAESFGCRVVHIDEKGYGCALFGGISAASGKYIIMGDSDDTYDFYALKAFLKELRSGYDLVMGNRFKGGIEKDAMPFLHRFVGNPVLSFIGRLFFKIPVKDFHCGLRGFTKEAFEKMDLKTTGMEFASEIVVKAALLNMKITEVPTTLAADVADRKPHLRTFRDGWRHLRFLLIYSPRWLFLYPGLFLLLFGLFVSLLLLFKHITLANVKLDIHTLLYAFMFFIVGYQFISFFIITKVFAINNKLIPASENFEKVFRYFYLERGLIIGLIFTLIGIVLSVVAFFIWKKAGFGNLVPTHTLRLVIPAVFSFILGIQTILNSFFLSILGLSKKLQFNTK
jgi:glycosyltransferase involved in cell wall biosynthesis